MKNILVRLEYSSKIGLGHITRCLNLLHYAEDVLNVYILVKYKIKKKLPLNNPFNTQLIYLNEDITDDSDALQTAIIAKKNNCELVITDLFHNEMLKNLDRLYYYHEKLKKELDEIYLFSIEDSRLTKFSSDIALIPYPYFKSVEKYPKQNFFKGLEYYIVHPSFTKYSFTSKKTKLVADKILIFISGSDQFGGTYKILSSIQKLSNISCKIILGLAFDSKYYDSIKKKFNEVEGFDFIDFTYDIGELFDWADIAIVGEGNIKFDALYSNTPSLMFTQFEHDSKPIIEFEKLKVGKNSGNIHELSEKEIKNYISNFLINNNLRDQYSKNCIDIINRNKVTNIFNEIKL